MRGTPGAILDHELEKEAVHGQVTRQKVLDPDTCRAATSESLTSDLLVSA